MSGCGAVSLPIVQIHPTRHCNLQCRHCYSTSGPKEREALGPDAIVRFLAEARGQGYAVASFSGGEPLLYPHFFDCAAEAGRLGFGVTVTTNGMLIDAACAERLATHVGLVAVSIDGPPDMHNSVRASAAAFEGALRGLAALRAHRVRTGIIHTLTPASLPHLRWLLDFARDQGVALLQLHPLEGAGRALDEMLEDIPDDVAATRAALLAMIIAESEPGMALQVDLFSRDLIEHQPRMIFAVEDDAAAGARLSDLVNPLVLETNGDVVPIAYGFGREFRVCNIAEDTLAGALPRFRTDGFRKLQALARRLRQKVLAEDDMPFLSWYDRITRASLQNAAEFAA
jgi:MoaA/NifB/PqqE/SkfB family radical SAM enzyme